MNEYIAMLETQSTLRKTCPNATSFITNPAWTGMGLNPGLHGEKPVAKHLNHGMVWNGMDKFHINLINLGDDTKSKHLTINKPIQGHVVHL
jgi:hypothetical protein